MLAETIKKIERQYEIKRGKADAIFLSEKKALYSATPRLGEIDTEITKKGIQTAKLTLVTNSTEKNDSIKKLQNDIYKLKEEKEKILKELNVTLAPKYCCSKCNDTGYIKSSNGISEMCSCMKQELINEAYNKTNMNNLKKQNFKNFNIELFSEESNPEKYGTNISPRDNIQKILDISQNFINDYSNNKETKNLLFTGTSGTGKTFLSKMD